MPNPIVIGRFGKAFGVCGWITVNSFTVPHEKILGFSPWFIKKNDLWEKINIESSKKRFDKVIVKLSNYNSPEEVRVFVNVEIGVFRGQLIKLENDEYYWVDLIGLKVVNLQGVVFGVVQELIATGSNDVLVVIGDRKYLIPYLSTVVFKVDLSDRIIVVDWEKDFL